MEQRRRRVKSKNMYKGPTDKDNNRGRIQCGRVLGQGKVMGENGDKLNNNNFFLVNKKLKKGKDKFKKAKYL